MVFAFVAAAVFASAAAHHNVLDPRLRSIAGPPPLASFGVHSGTGFFVDRDGWLLTNRHVALDGNGSCRRVSVGNASYRGVVADRILTPADAAVDLALVHVPLEDTPYLPLVDLPWNVAAEPFDRLPDEIRRDLGILLDQEGRAATVIGYPGLHLDPAPTELRATLLSRATAADDHWFPHFEAAIAPGSSGSPVIAADGDVVGVVFEQVEDLGTRAPTGTGIAVPAPIAFDLLRAAGVEPGAGPGRAVTPAQAVVRVFCFTAGLGDAHPAPRRVTTFAVTEF